MLPRQVEHGSIEESKRKHRFVFIFLLMGFSGHKTVNEVEVVPKFHDSHSGTGQHQPHCSTPVPFAENTWLSRVNVISSEEARDFKKPSFFMFLFSELHICVFKFFLNKFIYFYWKGGLQRGAKAGRKIFPPGLGEDTGNMNPEWCLPLCRSLACALRARCALPRDG